MTKTRRSLEPLPPHSREHLLVTAARSRRPPKGVVDADWQVFCALAGIATASTLAATKAVVTGTVAAKTATTAASTAPAAIAAKVVAGSIGPALVAKSMAIGLAIGLGAIGAGTIVERAVRSDVPGTAAVGRHAVPAPRHARQARPAPAGKQAELDALARPLASDGIPTAAFAMVADGAAPNRPAPMLPVTASRRVVIDADARTRVTDQVLSGSMPPSPVRDAAERRQAPPPILDSPPIRPATTLPPAAFPSPQSPEASLTHSSGQRESTLAQPSPAALTWQTQQLVKISRLLDSGAANEALLQLTAAFKGNVPRLLADEHDTLRIRALLKLQRRSEALQFANQLLKRSPNSTLAKRMHDLASAE